MKEKSVHYKIINFLNNKKYIFLDFSRGVKTSLRSGEMVQVGRVSLNKQCYFCGLKSGCARRKAFVAHHSAPCERRDLGFGTDDYFSFIPKKGKDPCLCYIL